MAYRPSFFLAIIGKVVRMLFLILFFQVIYMYTSVLSGWSFKEIFLLAITYLTVESVMIITFHRNLSYYLPDYLRKGDFDFLLTKPINLLFYTSFRIIDLMDSVSAVTIIYLWYYYISYYSLSLSFASSVLYIVFIFCAIVFVFSLLVVIASTAFWTINATGLGRFFENLIHTARFPTSIYRGFLSTLFLYIFPIGFVANVPSEVFLGKANPWYLGYALCFTFVFFFISQKIWNLALRRYSSASS